MLHSSNVTSSEAISGDWDSDCGSVSRQYNGDGDDAGNSVSGGAVSSVDNTGVGGVERVMSRLRELRRKHHDAVAHVRAQLGGMR